MSIFPKSRVLAPIDFSELSLEAIQVGLEVVDDPSHLYVFHVLPHLNPGEPGVMWRTVDDETRQKHVEETFREQFSGPEYEKVNFSSAIGTPSEEIIDFANASKIELIVISSHGRTGIGRFLLGSVAEKVVRYAHCPVLVLRR
ncbi:MAG: universal stress protein [Okeania sp. SIO2H7]|nr:universal stress protein [Okeania sp. SIO2H7]